MALCARRQQLPGPEVHAEMQRLRAGLEAGALEADRELEYYIAHADRTRVKPMRYSANFS